MNRKKYFIPGQRAVVPPSAAEAYRLRNFRPFVRQAGDDWRGPWFLAERGLLDYLVVYIGEGYGVFTAGDKTFKVKTGDLVWIPPGTRHEMRGTSGKMNCIYIHFDLAYDPARSHWNAFIPGGAMDLSGCQALMHPPIDDSSLNGWCGEMAIENKSLVKQLMKQICLEHKRSGERSFLLLSGLMLQLISILLADSEKKHHAENTRWREMEESAETIRLAGDKKISIDEVAKSCRLSPSHFRKIFREFHGISPRCMHNQAVIQKACEMLAYGKMNVSEIASKLGYSNVHNFSRSFSKTMKVSPKKYRKGGWAGRRESGNQ
ncbi:MAG: AraC family transcriptional regulator [Victivallales bacterium]